MAIDNNSRATLIATIPASALVGGAAYDLTSTGLWLDSTTNGGYGNLTVDQDEIVIIRKLADDTVLTQGRLTSSEAWRAWTLPNSNASGSPMYTMSGKTITFSESVGDYEFYRDSTDIRDDLPVISSTDTVYVIRSIKKNAAITRLASASRVTASTLNTAIDQAFFLAQEAVELQHNFDKISPFYGMPNGVAPLNSSGKIAVDYLGGDYLSEDGSGNWDAESKRMINISTPVGTADAVTKAYVDGIAVYDDPPTQAQFGYITVATGSATSPPGTNVWYTLPFTPASTTNNGFVISKNGVLLRPDTDFDVSASTLKLQIKVATVNEDIIGVQNFGISRSIIEDNPTVSGDMSISGALTANVKSTGSTTLRSLADREAEVVNVKDFGAVGNGTTDDRAAIQAAIDHSYLGGAATATVTITDLTEINNGDKVNLIATDTTSHDFTAGDVAGGGTWIAETDNNTAATNLATQINANAKFSASALGAVVTITQVGYGSAGNTTITLTDSGSVGMTKTNFLLGGSASSGTVYFPDGTYAIGKDSTNSFGLNINSPGTEKISLVGASRDAVIDAYSSNTSTNPLQGLPMINIEDAAYVNISSLTLKGNSVIGANGNGHAIKAWDNAAVQPQHLHLEDLHIVGFAGFDKDYAGATLMGDDGGTILFPACGVYVGGGLANYIEEIVFEDCAVAIMLDNTENSVIERCVIDDPVTYGIWLRETEDVCTVRDCQIQNVTSAAASPIYSGTTVPLAGLFIKSTTGPVNILGCKLKNSPTQIAAFACQVVTIDGCIIKPKTNTDSADLGIGSGVYIYECEKTNIERNQILYNSSGGASATFTFGDTEFDDDNNESITLIDVAELSKTYVIKNDDSASGALEFNAGDSATAAATNFKSVVESSGGHNSTIAVSVAAGVVTMTQAVTGSGGNTTIAHSGGWDALCDVNAPDAFTTTTYKYRGIYYEDADASTDHTSHSLRNNHFRHPGAFALLDSVVVYDTNFKLGGASGSSEGSLDIKGNKFGGKVINATVTSCIQLSLGDGGSTRETFSGSIVDNFFYAGTGTTITSPISLESGVTRQSGTISRNKQSGGGTFTNQWYDILADSEVNVKDFGATGTGVADDRAAIQAALDTGLTVFIPKGVYKITATLKPVSNQKVYGEGYDTIIRAVSSSFDTVVDGTGPSGVPDQGVCTAINATLNNRRMSDPLIWLGALTNTTVSGLKLEKVYNTNDHPKDNLLILTQCTRCFVKDIWGGGFTAGVNTSGHAFRFIYLVDCDFCQITECTFNGTSSTGLTPITVVATTAAAGDFMSNPYTLDGCVGCRIANSYAEYTGFPYVILTANQGDETGSNTTDSHSIRTDLNAGGAIGTVTITDWNELATLDKINLIAEDSTNYDFVCGSQDLLAGTWNVATSNAVTATNLMNVINTSSGPSGTRFTATVVASAVKATATVIGTAALDDEDGTDFILRNSDASTVTFTTDPTLNFGDVTADIGGTAATATIVGTAALDDEDGTNFILTNADGSTVTFHTDPAKGFGDTSNDDGDHRWIINTRDIEGGDEVRKATQAIHIACLTAIAAGELDMTAVPSTDTGTQTSFTLTQTTAGATGNTAITLVTGVTASGETAFTGGNSTGGIGQRWRINTRDISGGSEVRKATQALWITCKGAIDAGELDMTISPTTVDTIADGSQTDFTLTHTTFGSAGNTAITLVTGVTASGATAFTSGIDTGIVTITQATVGVDGNTAITLTDSGSVGMSKIDFLLGGPAGVLKNSYGNIIESCVSYVHDGPSFDINTALGNTITSCSSSIKTSRFNDALTEAPAFQLKTSGVDLSPDEQATGTRVNTFTNCSATNEAKGFYSQQADGGVISSCTFDNIYSRKPGDAVDGSYVGGVGIHIAADNFRVSDCQLNNFNTPDLEGLTAIGIRLGLLGTSASRNGFSNISMRYASDTAKAIVLEVDSGNNSFNNIMMWPEVNNTSPADPKKQITIGTLDGDGVMQSGNNNVFDSTCRFANSSTSNVDMIEDNNTTTKYPVSIRTDVLDLTASSGTGVEVFAPLSRGGIRIAKLSFVVTEDFADNDSGDDRAMIKVGILGSNTFFKLAKSLGTTNPTRGTVIALAPDAATPTHVIKWLTAPNKLISMTSASTDAGLTAGKGYLLIEGFEF